MIKINNLNIDLKSFGETFLLTGVYPYYRYQDGKRTNEVLGQVYEVAVVEQGFEKIGVKIPKVEPLIDFDENSVLNVKFDNLKVGIYQNYSKHSIGFKATADNLKVISNG